MNLRRRFMPVSEDELNEYLSSGPSERVAFVPARSSANTVAETLAAMANADGGLVLLGVTAKGTVQTAVDVNSLRDAATEAGLQTDPPLILPSAHVIPSVRGDVVVVQVPPGLPHIYSLRGMFMTRTGAHNRPLTTPELRRLLLERGEAGYEEQPLADATLADLSQQRIDAYLDHISLRPDEAPLQALLARGCIAPAEPPSQLVAEDAGLASAEYRSPDYRPTVAGMLLFGSDPQRFLRSSEIICVRYATEQMSDEFERQDITGTLLEQIRQAETFVVNNMRRGMRITGMTREENTEYPIAVVREAIVNAVAHRDYSIRGEGIRILMFRDGWRSTAPVVCPATSRWRT